MTSKWETKTLEEIAFVGAGNPAPQQKSMFKGGNLPFFRTSDVGQIRFGEISTSTDLLNDQGASGLRLVPSGTVLVPKSGASTFLNHRVITCADGYVSSHLATVTARPHVAQPRFLLYALARVQAQELLPENSYPSLNLSLIKGIKLPLPPLEEQQRIVAVLDEAFEGLTRARAHAEANLQNAQELFTASLRSLFSDNREDWPLRNIADVCIEFGRGKSRHRPRNDPRLYGGDMPFVQTGDLSRADHFLREFSQTYSIEGVAQSRVWPKGTVCVAIVGATIGESAILEFDACFPDSVIGMVPDPSKADSEFLDFLLQFVKADLKEAGKGSARDNINLGTFSDSLFPIPDLKAQLAAIERISEIDRECRRLGKEYAAKLQDLDDLRQSLLQKAFAGELT